MSIRPAPHLCQDLIGGCRLCAQKEPGSSTRNLLAYSLNQHSTRCSCLLPVRGGMHVTIRRRNPHETRRVRSDYARMFTYEAFNLISLKTREARVVRGMFRTPLSRRGEARSKKQGWRGGDVCMIRHSHRRCGRGSSLERARLWRHCTGNIGRVEVHQLKRCEA